MFFLAAFRGDCVLVRYFGVVVFFDSCFFCVCADLSYTNQCENVAKPKFEKNNAKRVYLFIFRLAIL